MRYQVASHIESSATHVNKNIASARFFIVLRQVSDYKRSRRDHPRLSRDRFRLGRTGQEKMGIAADGTPGAPQ
jgi:hypothetical protein